MIKILVVDDEIELCDLIAYQLSEEGFEVYQAYSMEEALVKFKDNLPSLVLSDMQMPAGTGIELFEKLKQAYKDFAFRFYILSGFISMDENRLLEHGINGVIKKPMSLEDILKAIKEV
jgi:CheY-like chemotaxis protein